MRLLKCTHRFLITSMQRLKVRIQREKLLDSCIKLVETYGKDRGVLEIEYFNEVRAADLNLFASCSLTPDGDALAVHLCAP